MEYDVKVAFEAHSLKVRFESDYSNSYLAKKYENNKKYLYLNVIIFVFI